MSVADNDQFTKGQLEDTNDKLSSLADTLGDIEEALKSLLVINIKDASEFAKHLEEHQQYLAQKWKLLDDKGKSSDLNDRYRNLERLLHITIKACSADRIRKANTTLSSEKPTLDDQATAYHQLGAACQVIGKPLSTSGDCVGFALKEIQAILERNYEVLTPTETKPESTPQ